jgi:hypothetical protein
MRAGWIVGAALWIACASGDDAFVAGADATTEVLELEPASAGTTTDDGLSIETDGDPPGHPGLDPVPRDPRLGRVPPPPPGGPQFVDVTDSAGLVFDPGEEHWTPDCLVDAVNWPGPGDLCTPERFLGAAAVGDFDGDDWPDIYFTRLAGAGLLMRNRGDGTFEEVAAARGLSDDFVAGAAAWADLEGDGDLDLVVTS